MPSRSAMPAPLEQRSTRVGSLQNTPAKLCYIYAVVKRMDQWNDYKSFPTVTLLNIPGFIERLCKLATRKVSEATGANFLQELEDWYTWLDNALVLDALMQMATEEAEQSSTGEQSVACAASRWLWLKFYELWLWELLLSESSDESSLATSPLRHRLPQSMKIVHEIMYKVEVLYVLCVLLMGRQRNQVRISTHPS